MLYDWGKIALRMLCKKSESSVPSNYRSIALANAILKIFTFMITRFSNFVTENALLPEAQSGFREGRSCVNNIFTLNAIVQLKLRQEKEYFLPFLWTSKRRLHPYSIACYKLNSPLKLSFFREIPDKRNFFFLFARFWRVDEGSDHASTRKPLLPF